jgi:hypothetical protein
MNPDDISARLERMYAVLGATENINLESHVERWKSVKEEITPHGVRRSITMGVGFNAKGGVDAENIALAAIEKVIGLKDHLKNHLSNSGDNPQDVEALINSSTHLCIALDLWNKEKHGSPLRSARSSVDPSLANIRRTVVLSGTGGELVINPSSGTAKSSGNVSIKVVGDVLNGSGHKKLKLCSARCSLITRIISLHW